MPEPEDIPNQRQSRRGFLKTGAAALTTAAAAGMPATTTAAPKRGGMLRFATRSDARGADPHRNLIYNVSQPLAATSQGLLDLAYNMEPAPGIATEWDIADDLQTYTFKLRRDVTFHNGADVDAAAVKWNFERIMDPKIGHTLSRSSLENIKEITVVDKHTLRCTLKTPSSVFLANIVYYPCNLIAPDSADQADSHPIGCGPFKFKSWKRWDRTEMLRYENYFETDPKGNPLPYLDGIVGLPKKQDRARLNALQDGDADLIDHLGYADISQFRRKFAGDFQTWNVPQVATAWVGFNFKTGPFSYQNPDSQALRQAAAHAIDRDAIHQSVFYGLGTIAKGFYGPDSPWYMPDIKGGPEYDPDKARFLLRKHSAQNTPIILVSRQDFAYMHQAGELVQAMWAEVGFKAVHEIHPNQVLREKYRKGAREAGHYDADSAANSYRADPDGWFHRSLFSASPTTKLRSGYQSERADELIHLARETRARDKRMQIYTDVENIINEELPLIYTHTVPLLQGGVKTLAGYQPAFAGPFSTAGSGIRTAYFTK
ncbi:MAG: ABC transporter substrate-binding protein [Rhodospirillaceae bacterium]|jgi:peptide/nickel transport system substrate-binding protein|nr:ABC transporter substrate-binding protein [Rhodospirillaceae bacterium]MBT5195359.1 ABC transporter substrate-binding protein [Rhodospirillaceae bacterium]MBT6427893.1 ABC transporter substrate-binding protein [Rhodospirillaceae bacterium]